MNDGANYQARAILAILQSYDDLYDLNLNLARFHNCREQGYSIKLSKINKTIHIVFFEHRSGDCICVNWWIDSGVHLNNANLNAYVAACDFGQVTTKTFRAHSFIDAAEYIKDMLIENF